jgi:hypothetical protein
VPWLLAAHRHARDPAPVELGQRLPGAAEHGQQVVRQAQIGGRRAQQLDLGRIAPDTRQAHAQREAAHLRLRGLEHERRLGPAGLPAADQALRERAQRRRPGRGRHMHEGPASRHVHEEPASRHPSHRVEQRRQIGWRRIRAAALEPRSWA